MLSLSFQRDFPFPDFLQVHFDGKKRKNLDTGEMQECGSTAVTGPGLDKEKFLSDVFCNGTGLGVAKAVHWTVDDWKIVALIVALCFDTTSVNTGRDNGNLAT